MAKEWLDVLQPGTLYLPTESGKFEVVTFSPDDVRNARDVCNGKLKAGWSIPVCLEHQDVGPVKLSAAARAAHQVRSTVGYIDQFAIKGNRLRALVDVADDEDAKVIRKVKQTSPYMAWNWVDTDKKTWPGYTVAHLAVTPRPRQRFQLPPSAELSVLSSAPVRRSCHLSHGEFRPMPQDTETDTDTGDTATGDLKGALAALAKRGIALPDDTTSANLLERIIIACTALDGAGGDDMEEMDDENVTVSTEPSPVAMSLQKQEAQARNLATKSLTSRVNRLVKTERVTPAIGQQLAKELRGAKLSFTTEGDLQPIPLVAKIEAYEALPVRQAGSVKADRNTQLSNVSVVDPEPEAGAMSDDDFMKQWDQTK